MKNNLKIFITLLVISLSGCDLSESSNYEIKNTSEGVIRLNTKNGEIVILKDNRIKVIDNIEVKNEKYFQGSIEKTKEISRTYLPGTNDGFWFQGRYKWRNGNIIYQIEFGPYSDDLHKVLKTNSITLNFLDSDYFTTANSQLYLKESLRIVDSSGDPTFWKTTGSIPCSTEIFKVISSVDYSWSFTEEFIEAAKANHIREQDVEADPIVRGLLENEPQQ